MIVLVFIFPTDFALSSQYDPARSGAEFRLETLPSPFAFSLRFKDLCVSSLKF
jgi:hypothetical protein